MADIQKLEIGTLVKLSGEAARMFPRLEGARGEVVSFSREGLPKVKFEGRKLISTWHPSMISKLKEPSNG